MFMKVDTAIPETGTKVLIFPQPRFMCSLEWLEV